jgi:hypothetical protein
MKPSLVRHETRCSVCPHEKRAEIEADFIAWNNVEEMAKEYGVTKDAIRRHARALDLNGKRDKNIRAALCRIVEHASTVIPNSNSIVAAAVAIAKINGEGRFIERRETLNLTPIFSRMSGAELEAYAGTGALPEWAQQEMKVAG